MYRVEYNGKCNTSLYILVKERPAIPSPEYDYDTVKIPGRDGDVYIEKKTVKDITIPISFTFACKPHRWQGVAREARKWLLGKGDRKLTLSDNQDRYYKVKHVVVNQTERQVKEVGEFSADFICEGRQYLFEGDRPLELTYTNGSSGQSTHVWNPYEVSMPVFIVSGSGTCRISVNGNVLEAEVNGRLTVDTQREVAYKADMSSANTNVTCDYETLALEPGDNTITKTAGFALQILPKWREI
jgi:predicted phage tail component-like protein